MSASILVLEDDPSTLEMLLETLEDEGFRCVGGKSADEAVEIAKKHTFDVVVSDVRMPGTTDGIGALEWLKARQPQLRCIVITGYAELDAPVRALKVKVDDYLYKPFGQAELVETVQRLLAAQQERSVYRKLLALPGKLLNYLAGARQESAQKALETARDGAHQAFFVGVRSKLLTFGAALDVWDRLEALEAAPDVEGYRELPDFIGALSRAQNVGSFKNREPDQVDRASFQSLLERVREGRVTPEQLRVAGEVWRTTPEERRQDPELARLYKALWK